MEALAVKVQEALGSRYRVERVAATGGMSTVLRAVDLKHDRVVAVKVLHDEVTDLVGTDRFLSEIQLVARLQHPHIVPLFDSGAADGLLFYTMPFIDGETLREKLRRCGPLGLNETLGIVRELCDALAYAHERDILHRDVKPENILLANGHALLTDFGVARAIHVASLDRHTGAGMAVGTVAYMSPEQASGEPVLDARSDVYSLGCVFYEMLAGVPPHEAPTPQALLAQRFRSAPKSLRAQRSDVNERLERVVRKALATAPNDRYADARAFANDLPITGDWSALHSKTTRRWPAIALGVLTAAAVSLGIRAVWNRWPIDEKIDASLYVVLPLSHEADRGQVAWRGDDCARMLFDAISRWTGIALVDEMRTRDAVEAEGGRITTLEQAVRVARRLRAGRLVWGSVVNAGGDTELRASVYDVVSRVPRAMAQERTRVASNGDVSPTISGVADSLIVRSALSRGSAQVSGSRNLEALTEYVAAHRALDRWELDTAYALFSSASSRDDGFAQAHLWAAQVASWLPG
ncbi:MAG: serine/threonine-protein kinase, partial [Gemmatimonadaceae bacterium]